MRAICEVKITGMGEGALDFVDDKILILFSGNAGNGVEEFSVQITMPQLSGDVVRGNCVRMGTEEYQVTAVGEEAMETFRLLGHCTLRFDGSDTPVLPGTIHLTDSAVPEVHIGDIISFYEP